VSRSLQVTPFLATNSTLPQAELYSFLLARLLVEKGEQSSCGPEIRSSAREVGKCPFLVAAALKATPVQLLSGRNRRLLAAAAS